MQEARGEYLLWLDSDDVLLPGVVRDAVRTLGQFPDVDIVYGDLESVDAGLSPLRVEAYRDWYRNPEGLLAAMAFWNELPNPGTLVRRRCYDALGPYAADYPRAQDYEWFTRVPGRAEVKHLGRTVCKWRHHDNGRATTGRDLEYDCRIVEAMLAAHAPKAISLVATVLAAGVMVGVLNNTGMIVAMAARAAQRVFQNDPTPWSRVFATAALPPASLFCAFFVSFFRFGVSGSGAFSSLSSTAFRGVFSTSTSASVPGQASERLKALLPYGFSENCVSRTPASRAFLSSCVAIVFLPPHVFTGRFSRLPSGGVSAVRGAPSAMFQLRRTFRNNCVFAEEYTDAAFSIAIV